MEKKKIYAGVWIRVPVPVSYPYACKPEYEYIPIKDYTYISMLQAVCKMFSARL